MSQMSQAIVLILQGSVLFLCNAATEQWSGGLN
jgi:hypothetical protein